MERTAERVREKIERVAARLVSTVDEIGDEVGIRVANKRISITPAAVISEGARSADEYLALARAIDEAAGRVGVDFIGGYSALVHKGWTRSESAFLDSIPEALASTERLCSSLNVATTRAGINMDAVARTGHLIKEMAERTRERGGLACAKFVCFANAVEDNPFMAGAFHGVGEPEAVINVGVSGPGVVNHAVQHAPKDLPLHELAELIKKLSFKLARAGELVGRGGRAAPGHSLRHHRPLAGPDARARRLRGGHHRGDGVRARRHARDDRRARAPDRRGQEGRRDGFGLGRRDERRFHPRFRRREHDRGGARGRALLGQARSVDQRLLGRHRHGGRARLDLAPRRSPPSSRTRWPSA